MAEGALLVTPLRIAAPGAPEPSPEAAGGVSGTSGAATCRGVTSKAPFAIATAAASAWALAAASARAFAASSSSCVALAAAALNSSASRAFRSIAA